MASLTLHCTPTLTLKKRVSRKLKGQSFIPIVLEQGYTTEEADEALRGPFIALNGQEDSKMLIYVRTAGVNSPDMKPLNWVWRTAKEDMAKGTGEERILHWDTDGEGNDVLEVEVELALSNAGVHLTTRQCTFENA